MYLNRERMRVVERNDRGVVTYRKSYKYGDEVDTSHMVEGRADALLASGALVESKDDLRERRRGNVPYPGSRVTGAATAAASDHSEIADEDGDTVLDAPVDPAEQQSSEDDDDDDDVEMVDEYTDMDYQGLQAAAEAKGIKANQSAKNLRAALRES